MQTIWKYTLLPDQTLEMPAGAQVLTVREQGATIALWAKVDTLAPTEKRRFVVFGTGHEMPGLALVYIGTAMLQGGALVLHAFEVA
jgi:hypothetical protein